MAQSKKKRVQQYDGSLKALFGDEAEEMIPYLVPGAQLLTDHNIEIDRTTLKADLVYNILKYGLPHILNMELQTKKEDRFRVEEEMKMQFDWFIDTVPQVIERVHQAEKRGK